MSINYDLAVLYVENSDLLKASPCVAVDIADSDKVHLGDTAIAIGNPLGSCMAVSSGVISVKSEHVTLTRETIDGNVEVSYRVMRVDTPVNKGNSGGGLFNVKGELIGIVNSKMISTEVDNVAHAIPYSLVVTVTENIIENCFEKDCESVVRPLLGISISTTDSKAIFDVETGLIDVVEEISVYSINSTSVAIDTLMVGDVLKSITIGEETRIITMLHHLIEFLINAKPDDVVSITIERNENGVMVEKTFSYTITSSMLTKY